MSLDRTIMRDMRRQAVMKLRLAQYERRQGFTLPERIPVTLEQLLDVRRQLEEALLRSSGQPPSTLN